MLKLYTYVHNLLRREEGQGMVEYALIVGMVAIGVVTMLGLMGVQVTAIFQTITAALQIFSTAGP